MLTGRRKVALLPLIAVVVMLITATPGWAHDVLKLVGLCDGPNTGVLTVETANFHGESRTVDITGSDGFTGTITINGDGSSSPLTVTRQSDALVVHYTGSTTAETPNGQLKATIDYTVEPCGATPPTTTPPTTSPPTTEPPPTTTPPTTTPPTTEPPPECPNENTGPPPECLPDVCPQDGVQTDQAQCPTPPTTVQNPPPLEEAPPSQPAVVRVPIQTQPLVVAVPTPAPAGVSAAPTE